MNLSQFIKRIKFVKVSIFVAYLFCGTFTHADVLPLDSFIEHGDYLELKLSPDGEHMAGRVRKDGSVFLYIAKTATQDIIGGVRPRKNSEIHSITWVSNDRIVFEFAQKFSRLDRAIATGELFSTNLEGTKVEMLYGFRAGDEETGRRLHTKKDTNASQEVISILEDDPKHILIAEYPWATKSIPTISKLNVITGKKTKIERVPFPRADILADKKGNVRFISWYDKNDKVHAATRQSAKDEWLEMEIPAGAQGVGRPVQINTAGTKVYFRVDLGKKKLGSLQELDLSSGLFKTLFTQKSVDLEFWESDSVTNEPVVGVSYPATSEYEYVEAESQFKTIHKQLVKAFKGQDVFITSNTKDGSKLLVRVTSDINPGEFYLFNTVTKKADFLWANLSWIDPRQMAPMRNITFKARDGLDISGLLTLPTQISDEKPPLLVIPHGGPHHTRDHWDFNQEVQLFANRGYAVLQVNFRGSGGYGGTFRRRGYREWGGKMIEDIIDGTNWAINDGNVAQDKVCIYGASYGGYAAMMAAITEPDLYKCAIGYVGVYDLNLMFSDGDIPRFWGGKEYLEKVLGKDEAVLNKYSPVNHADKLKAKIMLIHGVEDRRVPIKHANKMRKALKKAGKDVEWLRYGSAGHGVWNMDKRRDLYSNLLDFIDASLAN